MGFQRARDLLISENQDEEEHSIFQKTDGAHSDHYHRDPIARYVVDISFVAGEGK